MRRDNDNSDPELQRAYQKGISDGKTQTYESPVSLLDEFTTWSTKGINQQSRLYQQYNKGYFFGRGRQEKIQGSKYDPPTGDSAKYKFMYDKGWNSANPPKAKGTGDRGKSSGCFITTATTNSIGLGDNSAELNTFRHFRDNWIFNQKDGKKIIADYYKIAPSIVDKISAEENNNAIYKELWSDYLKQTLLHINKGRNIEAMKTYVSMVKFLQTRYQ